MVEVETLSAASAKAQTQIAYLTQWKNTLQNYNQVCIKRKLKMDRQHMLCIGCVEEFPIVERHGNYCHKCYTNMTGGINWKESTMEDKQNNNVINHLKDISEKLSTYEGVSLLLIERLNEIVDHMANSHALFPDPSGEPCDIMQSNSRFVMDSDGEIWECEPEPQGDGCEVRNFTNGCGGYFSETTVIPIEFKPISEIEFKSNVWRLN
jgi:hypothetical protein